MTCKNNFWGNFPSFSPERIHRAYCLLTFSGVQSFCSSTVFGIVVDEHVVGHSQEISLHAWGKWYDHLNKQFIYVILCYIFAHVCVLNIQITIHSSNFLSSSSQQAFFICSPSDFQIMWWKLYSHKDNDFQLFLWRNCSIWYMYVSTNTCIYSRLS